jgi:hypothetical protein
MEAYRIPGTAYNFFDAGILIGIGSLFYANLVWLAVIIIIGIGLLRTLNLKEIGISVIGLITPYFMTFGVYYISGRDLNDLVAIIKYNLFDKPTSYVFTGLTSATIIFTALVTLLSIFYLVMSMNSKKIKSRKTFYLLLWIFFISIGEYLVLRTVSVEIVWIIAIPVSYFLSHYFVFSRKKLVPEILFGVLFILIALIQIWNLK